MGQRLGQEQSLEFSIVLTTQDWFRKGPCRAGLFWSLGPRPRSTVFKALFVTIEGSNNLKVKIIQTAAPRELKTSHDAKISQVMHKHGLVLLQLQIPIISGAPACRRSQMELLPGTECVRKAFKLMTQTQILIGLDQSPLSIILKPFSVWDMVPFEVHLLQKSRLSMQLKSPNVQTNNRVVFASKTMKNDCGTWIWAAQEGF